MNELKELREQVKNPKIIKLPRRTKGWILAAAQHARRRGEEVPKDLHRFFD